MQTVESIRITGAFIEFNIRAVTGNYFCFKVGPR